MLGVLKLMYNLDYWREMRLDRRRQTYIHFPILQGATSEQFIWIPEQARFWKIEVLLIERKLFRRINNRFSPQNMP